MADGVGGGLGKVTGSLTKKVGPLPVWAWGLVVGIGIVAYMRLRGTSLSSSSSEETLEGSTGISSDGSGTSGGTTYLDEGGSSSGEITVTLDDSALIEQNASLAEQLGKQKAATARQKQRASRWKNWGQRWKKVAKRRAQSKDAKRSNNKKPKTRRRPLVSPAKKPGHTPGGPMLTAPKRNPNPRDRIVHKTGRSGRVAPSDRPRRPNTKAGK